MPDEVLPGRLQGHKLMKKWAGEGHVRGVALHLGENLDPVRRKLAG